MITPVICHRGMGLLEILRCLEHTHISVSDHYDTYLSGQTYLVNSPVNTTAPS